MRIHEKLQKSEAWSEAVEMFRLVGIPDPERRAKSFGAPGTLVASR